MALPLEPELMWAAGLLEAGGAFYATGRDALRGRIQCRSADPDVLERLHLVLGAGHVNGPYDTSAGQIGTRMTWIYQVNRQADVVRIGRALMPHMGRRRRQQIARMVEVASDDHQPTL